MDNQITIKQYLASDSVKARINDLLKNKAQQFIITLTSLTTQNPELAECEPSSVINACLVATAMDLPVNPNLGFAYILPYNAKQADGTYKKIAQMQLGYKAFIQLAQRSNQFKTISACPIHEGQVVEANPLTGYVFDFSKPSDTPIIGFAGYFKLLSGFEKVLFMSAGELQKHGKKYSQTFKKYNSGLWETDFEAMAVKTVLKLLLSKYAPLSTMPDMQMAVLKDQATIGDDGEVLSYVDNTETPLELAKVNEVKEAERTIEFIKSAKTIAELQKYEALLITPDVRQTYADKLAELTKKVK